MQTLLTIGKKESGVEKSASVQNRDIRHPLSPQFYDENCGVIDKINGKNLYNPYCY